MHVTRLHGPGKRVKRFIEYMAETHTALVLYSRKSALCETPRFASVHNKKLASSSAKLSSYVVEDAVLLAINICAY